LGLVQTKSQEDTLMQSKNLEDRDSQLWKLDEWNKCRLSPQYFLTKYGKISDPSIGAIDFVPWPHLIDLLKTLSRERLVIILKARQIGITWLMAGYAIHRAIFYQGSNVIILSKREDAAAEVLTYCKFIYNNLPKFLRPIWDRNQSSLMAFPAIDSKIRALSSTESSAVGFGGASLIILDENDHHKYAERDFAEIKPMVDAGGNRQLILLSAVNKKEDNTKFKKLYRAARAGENNFYPVFLPYNVLSFRDEAWYKSKSADLEDWEMEAQYPRTEAEALAPSQALCYFDENALDAMEKEDYLHPIEVRRNGMIKIYKKPVVGRRYCMAVDPSHGYDPFALGVMDWQSCEMVATAHGKIMTDELARITIELYEDYNKAFLAVERNPQGGGMNLIDKLQAAGVMNLYKEKDKYGWYTGSANRTTMLGSWREAIYKRNVRIYNRDMVDEHRHFIQEEGKTPRATKGSHDDYVMMGAILWAIRERIPMGKVKVSSFKYKDGWR